MRKTFFYWVTKGGQVNPPHAKILSLEGNAGQLQSLLRNGLAGMVVLGWRLDLMIFEVFSNLNDSMILCLTLLMWCLARKQSCCSWRDPHCLYVAVALHSSCNSWPDTAFMQKVFWKYLQVSWVSTGKKFLSLPSVFSVSQATRRNVRIGGTAVITYLPEPKDASLGARPAGELGRHFSCCQSRERRGRESHSDPGDGSSTSDVKSLAIKWQAAFIST